MIIKNTLQENITYALTQYSDVANAYLVMGAGSKSRILNYFFRDHIGTARPLWFGTDYQSLTEVMPFLARLPLTKHNLKWLDQQSEENAWGFLTLSPFGFDDVAKHLQSLTQIWIKKNEAVFFKFWDDEYSFPVIEACDARLQAQLLGPSFCWINRDTAIFQRGEPTFKPQSFPWFQLPETVSQKIFREEQEILENNVVLWLKENNYQFYQSIPEPNLRAKIKQFHKKNAHTILQQDELISFLTGGAS